MTTARSLKMKTHDGNYRQKYCMKMCIYGSAYGCGYKVNEVLAMPIESWQSCHYFRDKELVERIQKNATYDMMYGHMACYKDSHSAMWVD